MICSGTNNMYKWDGSYKIIYMWIDSGIWLQ